MTEILPPWPTLVTFIGAALVLAVSPGPGVFYIVTRSLVEGRRSGLASVAGVASGNLGGAIGAAIGLGTLFALSATTFAIVKHAGAAYLIYLGVQTLRRRRVATPALNPKGISSWRIFRDGFVVALFNPKTAIFFGAFLPQFMRTDTAPMLQGIALGALFVAVAAMTDSLYAVTAGAVAPFLRSRAIGTLARAIGGSALIGLGVLAAIGPTRNTR